jgi:peptide deformylase
MALTGPVTRSELARLLDELDVAQLEQSEAPLLAQLEQSEAPLLAGLGLVEMTHPALRRRARPIAREALGSPELERLVEAMWGVLDPLGYGVGLAAPQVGLPYALFCLDDHAGTRFALANPERVGLPSFEMIENSEGCLSIPGFWGQVRRSASRTVRGFLPDGREMSFTGEGFVARILAHETDHLAGRLYVDLALPGTFVPEDPDSLPGGWIFDRRLKPARVRARTAR